jgi:hypothetical protein
MGAQFPIRPECPRLECHILVRLESLPKLQDRFPQTLMTFTQQVDVGGAVPTKLRNKFYAGQLQSVCAMRATLDKSIIIDSSSALANAAMINKHKKKHQQWKKGQLPIYSTDEMAAIREAVTLFDEFRTEGKKIDVGSSLTSAQIKIRPGTTHGCGMASTTVLARSVQTPPASEGAREC